MDEVKEDEERTAEEDSRGGEIVMNGADRQEYGRKLETQNIKPLIV